MQEKPMVSVCMIAYNHENFIAEAIEGVMMQKTDFPVELVIGEDRSSDNTRAVILEYRAKYPDSIRPLFRESNLGMMPNFVDTLGKCSGKYIALCEGDDYWTDPDKLQIQIDLLESDPSLAICFHDVGIKYEGGSEQSIDFSVLPPSEVTGFDDLVRHGNFIHTSSCVYRNRFVDDFPPWFLETPIGDYVLHLLNARFGRIKYVDREMSSYRVHSGGVFSTLTEDQIIDRWLWVVEHCKSFFPVEHSSAFDRAAGASLANATLQRLIQLDLIQARKYFSRYTEHLKNNNVMAYRTYLHLAIWIGILGSYLPLFPRFYSFLISQYLQTRVKDRVPIIRT